jgi:hypothetical protein
MKLKLITFVFLAINFLLVPNLHADYFEDFVLYKAEKGIGRIIISNELYRGGNSVTNIDKNKEKFAKENIISYDLFRKRVFTFQENMDGHKIKILMGNSELMGKPKIKITKGLSPNPETNIWIYVDGKLKLVSVFGASVYWGITISKIIIYTEDDLIYVIGSIHKEFCDSCVTGTERNIKETHEILVFTEKDEPLMVTDKFNAQSSSGYKKMREREETIYKEFKELEEKFNNKVKELEESLNK